ncbi:Protein of unknown function [Lactobacillus acidophilus DSM 9126]|nr:Protein of unknown function [Lactobacillus acidophilus DSM 20079 = JCM 1132 = NBRC 13951 = CIP 76.13]CDF69935.1 Protein of unknown function [Lactobacillus acidophilus CIRM-BIA 442]CDF71731.1 Protein of unknown function [Lactobacillus acidophilus CIRM-BIA 445]CDF73555.1 Protein of unknown function [Lactobacillus acidophilus DSM 9126]CDF75550.1 Protein of unknown function [Lactobacillus acidophilus DSM 20242]
MLNQTLNIYLLIDNQI